MPTKQPLVYRWYYILQTEENQKESGFKKNVYALINQNSPYLIHYVGDETLAVPFAHKSSKDKTIVYKRTAPSCLTELKNSVAHEDAHIVYKNSQAKFRNLKQCQNFKQYINKQKRLMWDEIFRKLKNSTKM